MKFDFTNVTWADMIMMQSPFLHVQIFVLDKYCDVNLFEEPYEPKKLAQAINDAIGTMREVDIPDVFKFD